jgi:hypothetical protein
MLEETKLDEVRSDQKLGQESASARTAARRAIVALKRTLVPRLRFAYGALVRRGKHSRPPSPPAHLTPKILIAKTLQPIHAVTGLLSATYTFLMANFRFGRRTGIQAPGLWALPGQSVSHSRATSHQLGDKGGTLNRPLTRVSSLIVSHMHFQGRNVPSRTLMHNLRPEKSIAPMPDPASSLWPPERGTSQCKP